MREEKPVRRGWVKNAAIVFLIIMLILTLFSNTIRNATLPEVAEQTVKSDSISAKVRGEGVIEARGAYDVMLKQSYKVSGVSVRVGDKVEVGDLLFTLEGGDSTELREAREALDDARLQYQIDLANAESEGNYTLENRKIEKLREKLEKAKTAAEAKKIEQSAVDAAEKSVKSAEEAVTAAQTAADDAEIAYNATQDGVDKAQTTVDNYQSELGYYSPSDGGGDSTISRSIAEKEEELEATKLAYAQELDDLKALARAEMSADGVTETETLLKKYMNALAMRETTDAKLRKAYNAVRELENAIASLNAQYWDSSGSDTSGEYYSTKRKLDKAREELNKELEKQKTAKKTLDTANKAVEKAKSKVETEKEKQNELKTKQKEYQTALDEVDAIETQIDEASFELEQKIAENEKNSKVSELKLESKRLDITRKQERVSELEKTAAGGTVTAPQAGIVSELNVKAGGETPTDSALAVIEAPDLGYQLSFSVTNEQAKKLSTGASAEVSSYWWGTDISATLRQIKNDPKNPKTNKLLVFDLSGDGLEAGSNLTIAVGERSQSYDVVVPNSAVRKDSTGSYVLIVEAKSVPLGTRYTARRVDVQVLASDDTNSALAGGLSAWSDWVITSSSKPIESGMQVRLAEK